MSQPHSAMHTQTIYPELTPLAAWFSEIPVPELELVLVAAVQGAVNGLSDLVERPIHLTALELKTVPIAQIATHVGDPESEMVGVYLLIEGDLQGQAILMLSLASALKLADMLLESPLGTATRLGELERSALAEAGNVVVSCFLNTVTTFLKKPQWLHPSPPAVMVDMLGAILDVVAAPIAAVCDDLLIVETVFTQKASVEPGSVRTVRVDFWVLPEALSLPSGSPPARLRRAGNG